MMFNTNKQERHSEAIPKNSNILYTHHTKKKQYKSLFIWMINIIASIMVIYGYRKFFTHTIDNFINWSNINKNFLTIIRKKILEQQLLFWSNNISNKIFLLLSNLSYFTYFLPSIILKQALDIFIINICSVIFLLDYISDHTSLSEMIKTNTVWNTTIIIITWITLIFVLYRVKQFMLNYIYIYTGLDGEKIFRLLISIYDILYNLLRISSYQSWYNIFFLVSFLIMFIFSLTKYIFWTIKLNIQKYSVDMIKSNIYNQSENKKQCNIIKNNLEYKINQFYNINVYIDLQIAKWSISKLLLLLTFFNINIPIITPDHRLETIIYLCFLFNKFIYISARDKILFLSSKFHNIVHQIFEKQQTFISFLRLLRIYSLSLHLIGMFLLILLLLIFNNILKQYLNINLFHCLWQQNYLDSITDLHMSFKIIIFWFDIISIMCLVIKDLLLLYMYQVQTTT